MNLDDARFEVQAQIADLRVTVSLPRADLDALVELLADALSRRSGVATVEDEGGDGDDRMLDAVEAAALLGYTPRYVLKLGREGEIPRHKLEGRRPVRFRKADVLAYRATRRTGTARQRAVQMAPPARSNKSKWERRTL